MVNKKTIVAGLLIVFAILVVAVVAYTRNPATISDITTANIKSPPMTQQVPEQATISTPILSYNTDITTCQQPPKGNQYGGIGGTENNPPNGTAISQELTTKYGISTATGICGTYSYIVGWWFNATEMANLPSETLLYGVSPYAITKGDGGSNPGEGTSSGDSNGDIDTGDDGGDEPIIPVPEVPTIILVVLGIFIFVAYMKTKK